MTRVFLIPLICFNLLVFTMASSLSIAAQEKNPKLASEAKLARQHSLSMLDEMMEILDEHYYDRTFRGIDVKARIEQAKARVRTLQYNWQMFRVLVQVLMDFDDSHTRMILPPRTDHFDYGFGMQMIGEECYITSVKKDSDAFKKGVRVGDQVLRLGKFTPNRRDLWKMLYVLYKLDPSRELDLTLKKVDGTTGPVRVIATTMTDKEYSAYLKAMKEARKKKQKDQPFKCEEISGQLLACKLYSFMVDKNDIDKMITQALRYPKLVLDLRGNRGGYVIIEEYLLSHFFDRKVKIGEMVTRKKKEIQTTKPVGARRYSGELAVLVDSNSASAAETTSYVLQLEKRGTVYGDTTSGSVMTSISVPFESVVSALSDWAFISVGMSVTVADVVMSDGTRLEHRGVIPDTILQPNANALASRTDPVLAFVAEKLGSELTPAKAGTLNFLVPEEEPDDEDAGDY
jgi:carboxyl-terminal processing protease